MHVDAFRCPYSSADEAKNLWRTILWQMRCAKRQLSFYSTSLQKAYLGPLNFSLVRHPWQYGKEARYCTTNWFEPSPKPPNMLFIGLQASILTFIKDQTHASDSNKETAHWFRLMEPSSKEGYFLWAKALSLWRISSLLLPCKVAMDYRCQSQSAIWLDVQAKFVYHWHKSARW